MLRLFSRERPTLALAELAGLSDLARSTGHRYTSTLVELGYLQQDNARKYTLAPKAADPGLSVLATIRRALAAQEALEGLREQTGYTASLGVLNGTAVTYVRRLHGHRRGQYQADMQLRAGAHIPLHCSALGKAILATLAEQERRELVSQLDLVPHGPRSIVTHKQLLAHLASLDGLAPVLSDEELTEGARSIAIRVPHPQPERATAIEVTVPSTDLTAAQLQKRIGPHVKHAAKLIALAEQEQPRAQ